MKSRFWVAFWYSKMKQMSTDKSNLLPFWYFLFVLLQEETRLEHPLLMITKFHNTQRRNICLSTFPQRVGGKLYPLMYSRWRVEIVYHRDISIWWIVTGKHGFEVRTSRSTFYLTVSNSVRKHNSKVYVKALTTTMKPRRLARMSRRLCTLRGSLPSGIIGRSNVIPMPLTVWGSSSKICRLVRVTEEKVMWTWKWSRFNCAAYCWAFWLRTLHMKSSRARRRSSSPFRCIGLSVSAVLTLLETEAPMAKGLLLGARTGVKKMVCHLCDDRLTMRGL